MRLVTVFCLVALLMAGCAAPQGSPGGVSTSGASTSGVSSYANPGSRSNPMKPGPIPSAVAAAATSSITPSLSDYRLGPYDIVTISVFNVPELTGDFQVGPNGGMALPLVGEVKAAGQTPQQLQSSLSSTLGKTYLQSPQVLVAVKDYRSQRVTVEGAVNKPGVFGVNNTTTLLQAVALAEGPTRYATLQDTLVFRTANGQKSVARFDLTQIRSGTAPDPMIQSGDVVVVTENAAKSALRDILQALPIASLFVAIL